MGLPLRPPETIPSVWGKWKTDLADYVCYYTIAGWGDRIGGHLNEEQLRSAPCKLCKKRCKTPVTQAYFYLASAPMDADTPVTAVGSF